MKNWRVFTRTTMITERVIINVGETAKSFHNAQEAVENGFGGDILISSVMLISEKAESPTEEDMKRLPSWFQR